MVKKDDIVVQPLKDMIYDEEVERLPNAAIRAPFAVKRSAVKREGDTEDLLNGMIAECHFAMREIAVPSACETSDRQTRTLFLSDVIGLTKAGAVVGKTVAMLRAASRDGAPGDVLEQVGRVLPAIEKNG